MALPVAMETISSLAEASNVRNGRGIDEVQFHLHPQTSLRAAEQLMVRTRPGNLGYRLLNPELMDCKFYAKVELHKAYDRMFEESMRQCDQELIPLRADIAELRRLLIMPENQIPHVGPDRQMRNRGVQQVIYLEPQFPIPLYESDMELEYQPPYATEEEREAAICRDRLAQRAWWRTNLTLLETKLRILEAKRTELERALTAEIKNALESQSNLGAGYANYQFRFG